MRAFETTTQVRFAHVDGAGIVFYPRYFEMLNAAVEDWFAQDLGADFRTMHEDLGIGVPTVQVSAEFQAPSKLGDELSIRLQPLTLGRTSCAYVASFSVDGHERLCVRGTLVCMNLRTQKAEPWPDDIRERILHDSIAA